MPRARNVPATRKRRKKVLKKARGFFGNKSRLFRYAKDAVDRGEVYAYALNSVNFGSFVSMQPAVRKVCVTENLSTD
jgi:large subunit ribosomal protein L20